jgi:hypothetical protein
MVHGGVDLHQRMSQIAVLTADGELSQHRVPNVKGAQTLVHAAAW